MAEELFGTVLSEIKQKYPDFISRGRHYPGLPWRFKRAIHIVDSTTIKLIAIFGSESFARLTIAKLGRKEFKSKSKCIFAAAFLNAERAILHLQMRRVWSVGIRRML